MFQRDAQTITPEALESVKAALASSENEHKAETKKKAIPRKAAGQTWEDPTLADWPESKLYFCYIGTMYCNHPVFYRMKCVLSFHHVFILYGKMNYAIIFLYYS